MDKVSDIDQNVRWIQKRTEARKFEKIKERNKKKVWKENTRDIYLTDYDSGTGEKFASIENIFKNSSYSLEEAN